MNSGYRRTWLPPVLVTQVSSVCRLTVTPWIALIALLSSARLPVPNSDRRGNTSSRLLLASATYKRSEESNATPRGEDRFVVLVPDAPELKSVCPTTMLAD